MLTDAASHEVTESASLPADVTDDSSRLELIEIVPLTRDTDGPCTTECDSGDWSAEVKQEMLPDYVTNDYTESTSLPYKETDDSCRLELIEIVPLTRDADGPCTTKCDSGDWSAEVKQGMLTDYVTNDYTESASLPADVTDDSCRLELIEIVPLTRDADGPCTTDCDSGDWSAEVKQEILPVVKQEPEEVCYTRLLVTE